MPGFLSGGEKPRARTASEDAAASRMSGFFMSEEARREMLEWMMRALGSKRVAQKLSGDHNGVVLEHAWIFQFIDIIYVGTIFKLSHLIGNCGRGVDVYMLTFSYFAIMFSTRQAFDVYTCISGANGILHLIAFCFYGIGVFIMTVNISSHSKHESLSAECSGEHALVSSYAGGVQVTYGSCERSIDYDIAFAAAFVFTRFVLVVMYGLYFFVFHESNIIGHAPAMDSAGTKLRFSDLTRESDLEAAMRESEMKHTSSKHPAVSTESHHSGNHNSHDTSVDNPLTRLTMHRPSFVIKVANNFRESVVKKHFTRIFALKVAPVILSSIVVSAMLFGASPVAILPIVAFIEFAGDFLPSYFVSDPSDWRDLNPHRHFAQERLGLFFMLVMGEAVLGFASVNYTSDNMSKIYRGLLFSFTTIFTVGMQHFEPLQSYTKPEGPHPLDVQKLSPIYIWMVCTASFFMLIAANGMVELYQDIGAPVCVHLDHRDLNYEKQKVANGLGSVVLIIILLKLLDKVYYRERLLPAFMFNWLNEFYHDAEETMKSHSAHGGCDDCSGHSVSDLRASMSERQSVTVVAKDQVAIGIRKIKPLTNLKILCATFMFLLWHFEIATEDYMCYTAALVVFPSFVEVILEVRNFFLRQRTMRQSSTSVQLGPMGAGAGAKGGQGLA